MTRNTPPTPEAVGEHAVDEHWVAHLRELSVDVVPPAPADPHVMSRTAIRRTRTRRTVLATGGGLMTVAAVAGTAFALSSPVVPGMLLPGGSTSAVQSEAAEVPDGWTEHAVAGLSYGLPADLVTSGPVDDEPGVTSDMWHSSKDPDSAPFLRMAFYESEDRLGAWPGIAQQTDVREFELPGAESATVSDITAEVAGLPGGTDVPDSWKGPTLLVIERADGPGLYVITLNLPRAGSDEFVEQFRGSLSLS